MTGASLEHDTGLVSLGLHGGKDLPVGVVQIHQDIAGIAAVGIGMEVDVVSLQVPSAQKPYHGPLGQQASGPQPFSRAGDSGAMLNQTHQVEFVGHGGELSADGLPGDEESAVDHQGESAAKPTRRTMDFQRMANSVLTGCLTLGVHSIAACLWLSAACLGPAQ